MYVCNTGLECEECIGGCENNLEWEDDFDLMFPIPHNSKPKEDNHE